MVGLDLKYVLVLNAEGAKNQNPNKMTDTEEKSLKAQLLLSKEINSANDMIIHTVQSEAAQVLREIIDPKTITKKNKEVVEIPVDEFTKIRMLLHHLSSNGGFERLNKYIKSNYIDPKKEKQKILDMLR